MALEAVLHTPPPTKLDVMPCHRHQPHTVFKCMKLDHSCSSALAPLNHVESCRGPARALVRRFLPGHCHVGDGHHGRPLTALILSSNHQVIMVRGVAYIRQHASCLQVRDSHHI